MLEAMVLRFLLEALSLYLKTSFFNIAYELSKDSEKLYFDNPLGEPLG